MSRTGSIVLALALVLLAFAVVLLALRRHRGGRHRAPEPLIMVIAARATVGVLALGSMASSMLVLLAHGPASRPPGPPLQAAARTPDGAPTERIPTVDAAPRSPFAAPSVPDLPSPRPALSAQRSPEPTFPEPQYTEPAERPIVVPPPRSPVPPLAVPRIPVQRAPVESRSVAAVARSATPVVVPPPPAHVSRRPASDDAGDGVGADDVGADDAGWSGTDDAALTPAAVPARDRTDDGNGDGKNDEDGARHAAPESHRQSESSGLTPSTTSAARRHAVSPRHGSAGSAPSHRDAASSGRDSAGERPGRHAAGHHTDHADH